MPLRTRALALAGLLRGYQCHARLHTTVGECTDQKLCACSAGLLIEDTERLSQRENWMNERKISLGVSQERQEVSHKRLMERHERTLIVLWQLIADLSIYLAGPTTAGLVLMRRRVANALPPHMCPDWLKSYRDPAVVRSDS